MAGNDVRMERWEIALDDVKIGAADAAGENFEQNFAGLGWGRGTSSTQSQEPGAARMRIEDGGAHQCKDASEDKGSAAGAAGS